MHRIIAHFIAIAISFSSLSQILPAENRSLHYTLVGFRFPENVNTYTLEVAIGNYNNNETFNKHKILRLTGKGNKTLGRVPYFGKEYTWRVNGGEMHHFSTQNADDVDSTKIRLRVTKNDHSHKDMYVFLDFNKVLYDLNGEPVWFLPEIDGIKADQAIVRDMKLTNAGTITLLLNNMPYEISYDGEVLWKAPDDGKVSGDKHEHYHHEFTRLSNGHYMTLGNENTVWQPTSPEAQKLMPGDNAKSSFGTVIEYDQEKNVTWYWKSSSFYKNANYTYDSPPGRGYDIHQNAFFFDEKNKAVYISFRNIDQLIKVKYPDGKIANVYHDTKLICEQHNCRKSTKGYLYIFNNNLCAIDQIAHIITLKEGPDGSNKISRLWEYTCPELATNISPIARQTITTGGSVTELRDGSFLASVCAPYADIFIVGRDKKLRWYAVPEQYSASEKKWLFSPQYRVSAVERTKDLERAIWRK